MAAKHTRLELTWIGKDERPRLEPRILLEDRDLSYHAQKRVESNDIFDNILIHGDNLLALKSLEQDYLGMIKCIYIDPPYNTGSAFEHYQDNLEHSTWLSLMRDRLNSLKLLLREDGFLCCHIDDSEGHYLKVLLDEVFGRANYLATLYVRVRYPSKTLKQDMDFHREVEYVHIYRKSPEAKPNKEEVRAGLDKFCHYIEINDSPQSELVLGGKRVEIFSSESYKIKKAEGSPQGLKEIWATGTILDGNSSGRFFRDYLTGRSVDDGLGALYRVYGIGDDDLPYRYFTGPRRANATKGKYFQGVPSGKDLDASSFSPILGFYDLAGAFGNCRHEGGVEFRSGKKPEALLQIVLRHFSSPGDIVLDSFAGSGTTGAVAHKMGRRWIMVELGDHCYTHIIPRLRSVVEGRDLAGITNDLGWRGGGGFRMHKIASSLLEKDKWGNWVVSKQYNPVMLAEAMCKLEGFRYAPDADDFWIHGHSTETDLIYVTTQNLSHEQLQFISEQVGDGRTLLICCSAFRAKSDAFANLTLKKIPQAVLHRCEWGRDDYSLNVNALSGSEPEADQTEEGSSEDIPAADSTTDAVNPPPARRRGRPRRKISTMQELPLFANLDQGGDA